MYDNFWGWVVGVLVFGVPLALYAADPPDPVRPCYTAYRCCDGSHRCYTSCVMSCHEYPSPVCRATCEGWCLCYGEEE